MINELTLKSRFTVNITVKSLIIRGKVSELLEKLQRNNTFEISDEVIEFLNRSSYYELRGCKIVKVVNINSRETIRQLKAFNEVRKEEHRRMKQIESIGSYTSSSDMKLNEYNDRQTREFICGQLRYGI